MSETRRLVAIFYADVAGYSRLTGTDEVGTHRQVMAMLDDATARELVKTYARLVYEGSEGVDEPKVQMQADIEDMSRYKRPEDLELMIEGYRKAGLPV